MTYSMEIAGLRRELPLCRVSDDLYIAAFICFGDAEITVKCAEEMLKLLPEGSYDYLFTAKAKGIPIIHEMVGERSVDNHKRNAEALLRQRRRGADPRQAHCVR